MSNQKKGAGKQRRRKDSSRESAANLHGACRDGATRNEARTIRENGDGQDESKH